MYWTASPKLLKLIEKSSEMYVAKTSLSVCTLRTFLEARIFPSTEYCSVERSALNDKLSVLDIAQMTFFPLPARSKLAMAKEDANRVGKIMRVNLIFMIIPILF